ncbi:unnamed protein product [Didymodactylos carnosus]|uniref:Solute carrier family 66 member 2 n=1 Tax=Didymodactylos carnosus TaxID=1234261 RepID=A0A814F8S7_9BILA|nr:unnamed protein product [Didymodactylos carnosus]CAF0978062.1 unnamed protein product [Didymodactylos carnosus]CAF3556429.1 unnamed protein product [Didymodactylos carnosus]CAF3750878.1 unnamed protein product [Didymodactylos carnosus]
MSNIYYNNLVCARLLLILLALLTCTNFVYCLNQQRDSKTAATPYQNSTSISQSSQSPSSFETVKELFYNGISRFYSTKSNDKGQNTSVFDNETTVINTTSLSILSSMFNFDTVNMSDFGSVFSWALSIVAQALMIFGGVVPYIPQYLMIKRTQNAEGFSNYVCLTLLVANIIRIEFWFGKHFEIPLLLQSIIMIVCMLIMLELWTRVHTKSYQGGQQLGVTSLTSSEKRFIDFDIDYFWKWTTFASYVQFLCLFTFVLSTITWVFVENKIYIETIGFLAVFFEALLGTPQFLRNYRHKSTDGMSVGMVLMWTSGDIFKTSYFLIRKAPKQFWLCGSLQIAIDIAILFQVFIYSDKFRNRKR